MGDSTGAGWRLMQRLQSALRRGLALLAVCSPLLALGAGEAPARGNDPDAALGAVFQDIERSRLGSALEKVDALITAYPNFRLAHLIRGDLLLARAEKEDPLSFRGSYAGAMGWPQFMPSSFRAFAVDWNNDGHHDIWNTPADAMASVASYLSLHGWKDGGSATAPAL